MTSYQREAKARAMMWKKPMVAELNYGTICNDLYDLYTDCEGKSEEYMYQEIVDILDGDEETAHEYQMLFGDLASQGYILQGRINDWELCAEAMYNQDPEEMFNNFFAAIMKKDQYMFSILGYDSYREDYFPIEERYNTEAAIDEARKRLKRMTKDQIIDATGDMFGIAIAYFDLKRDYDYLNSVVDIAREDHENLMKTINGINDAYERAEAAAWIGECVYKFDALCSRLPDKVWVQ